MKIKELFDYVASVKPHVFPDTALTIWLNEIEGRIQREVFLTAPAEIIQYAWPGDQNTELLVDGGHSGVYRYWLQALIDFENGEYEKYQNTMEMFNAHYGAWVAWFAENYRPADGGGVWDPPYYLTAYGIAVKHGYSGTEEQWLETLRGAKGDKGDPVLWKGQYDTLAELESALPTGSADNYLVGTHLYWWDGTQWADAGSWQGPQGTQGLRGQAGADGSDGARGADGADGVTFTPAVDASGNLSWTNDGGLANPPTVNIKGPAGADGADGQDGAVGPKGDSGQDFRILGYYGTLAALQAAQTAPEAGDAYGVGTVAPYHIYVFDGVNRVWVDNGTIQGPAGSDGVTFTPAVDDAGNLSWTNDGGRENPPTVNIKGPAGTGSGDMAKAVYDPQNKAQDIFAYADAAAAQASEKEIFVAIYGTTGWQALMDAVSAGKTLFCQDQNKTWLAPLHSRGVQQLVFCRTLDVDDPTLAVYSCTQGAWNEATVRLLPAAGATMGGNLDMAGWDVDKIGALGLGDPDAGVSIYEEGTAEAPVVGFYGHNADEPVILANIAAPTGSSHGANKGYVDQALAGKQDKLTGAQGQVVGFDASGAAVAQAAPSGGDKNWYGVCSTASSAAAKTVNVGDGFVLKTGVRVTVKFLETNNATGPSLNVNGTGAKGITLYGSVYSSEYDWIGGAVETLVYDGTYWVLEGAAPSTLVYRGRTKLQSVPNTSETVAATPNCVLTALARTNSVNLANTAYTTYMARGEALFATETTPTVNGAIAWQYE